MDTGKHYDFGLKDGHTFIDEGNIKKREEYWRRHLANKKEYTLITNLVPSPATFSAFLLWGQSKSLEENIKFLNHEWEKKHGKGIMDTIKSVGNTIGNAAYNYLKSPTLTQRVLATLEVFMKGRHRFLPSAQKVLEQYGNLPITEMEISRHPIQGVINAANTLTGNELDRLIKESPYDTLYHLGLFVKCGGHWVEVEKESTVKITAHKDKNPHAEILVVNPADIPQGLTMNIMLAKTQAHLKDNFFNYSARNANCQDFVRGILFSNGIRSQEYDNFVRQDVQGIFNASSHPDLYRKITNTLTDLGHLGETFLEGGRIAKKNSSRRSKPRGKVFL